MMLSQHVLQVAGVSKSFGGLQALSDVHLTIERGQVYGLIGPNGAGKTTFFNVITGLYPADSGSFILADHVYEPKDVHLVAKAGIARTFQNIRLFADMTALENVMVARHVRTHSGLLGAIFQTKAFTQEEKEITEKAHDQFHIMFDQQHCAMVMTNFVDQYTELHFLGSVHACGGFV
jgi:branched-chain amino acid transport system ATP-binding protein